MVKQVFHLIETSGPGGAENMLINMVRGLAEEGIGSTVLLLKPGWLEGQLQQAGAEVVIKPLVRSFDRNWLWAVALLIRERKPDVLHSHEFSMNMHAAVLSRLTGRPAVSTVHGRNYYAERWHRRLAYRLASRQSRFVAVSKDIARFLSDRVGIPSDRLIVLPNGVDIARYAFDEAKRKRMREALHCREGTTAVLAVGNLYPVKGHSILLKAAREVLRDFSEVRFYIAGQGGERKRLEALADSLGIKNSIVLLGYRDDVHDLLCAADIFVLPSRSEGHPLSLLEAMACRRPVVASAVGGIPEVIENGHNGFLFDVGDSRELARRLVELIADVPTARRVAVNGYATVAEKMSNRARVGGYLELYRNALADTSEQSIPGEYR